QTRAYHVRADAALRPITPRWQGRGAAMRENTAKAKLKAGQAIIGPIIGFTSPQLVEIAGRAGFDFVFIDCEHGAIGLDECANLVRAADVVGVSTIVRVPENNAQ